MSICSCDRKVFEKLPFEIVDPKENETPKVNFCK